ncbi:hypothetical protein, partial [Mariprofundus erugo]|uniref:hypothetical protein n=1 Tax=Mariprofundus erugo TaxID=2528639 RepID=UPI001EE7C507
KERGERKPPPIFLSCGFPHASDSLQPLHPQLVSVVNHSVRQIYKGGLKRDPLLFTGTGFRAFAMKLCLFIAHEWAIG